MGSSDSESDSSSSQSTESDTTGTGVRSELLKAIENGSVGEVAELLRRDGEANIRFRYRFTGSRSKSALNGTTPLMVAAAFGNAAIVQLLLDHGANVDDINHANGGTAIHRAAEHGQSEIIDVLVKNGASANDLDDFNHGPLGYAVWAGSLETVKRLISNGADLSHVDFFGWNALGWACRYGQANIARFLLDLAAERNIDRNRFLNVQDEEGWTSINRAVSNSHFDCVQELISEPLLDPTLRDEEGDSALSLAGRRDYVFIMVQILGMEVYFPDDPVGCSACIATPFEFHYIQKALLNGLEQALRKPLEQDRAMFWAVANGSAQLVEKCIERQPDLLFWSRAGANWLHVAGKYGRHELIKMLVSRGVDVCAAANNSMTALHLAAEGGHRATVKYILESLQGIINSPAYKPKDPGAGRPLSPRLELIKLIMEENDDCESPLTLSGKARNRGASDILWGEIEKFAMTTPNFIEFLPIGFERLTEVAAQFERPGDERILKLLLEQTDRGDFNWETRDWTALHWAVDSSRVVLVWWLLSNGGHLRREEIRSAIQIVKDRTTGHGLSEVDQLIVGLLENPPMVSVHADNEDDYHLPELPALPASHRGYLERDGIIVDFHCDSERDDFQFKRRTLREIIYERGPSSIMECRGGDNQYDLEKLKQRLEEKQQPHITRACSIQGATRQTLSDTDTGSPKSQREDPGNPFSKDRPSANGTERKEPSQGNEPVRGQPDFRWIHIPARDMKTAEDLITRIVIDAGKTKWQHGPLANLLKQSLIEVAAGGGKRYIKPQFIGTTVEESGYESETDSNSDSGNENGDGKSDESRDAGSESSADESTGDSVALYMPFLTSAEILPAEVHHAEESQGQTVVSRTMQPQDLEGDDPSRALHERMTLDQYYYTTLPDSTYRDHDQVLSRYLAWQEFEQMYDIGSLSSEQKGRWKPIKVFSVDQLWLWVIDERTIVTASTSDFEGLVDTAFDALVFGETKGGYPRPTDVQSMTELMMGIVTGPQMQSAAVPGKKRPKQPLEIFRESIRHVADIETKMSRNFIDSVVGGYCAVLPKRDVGKEYRLLYEIKDIREELTILKALTEAQETVWSQVFHAGGSRQSFRFGSRQDPRKTIMEIKEMAREAESVQDAINTLLDLRQKHAGNQDAQFGRQQANTTMVFTVVTIIFLPLSFLASLFALDVAEFPHESSDVRFKASWIFPIIFGCSAAVSIPSIIIAFNVNELIMIPYYRWFLPSQFDRNDRDSRSQRSSARQLTEDIDSTAESGSMVTISKQESQAARGRFSRQSTGKTMSSLYDQFLGRERKYQEVDCESGKG